jgi:hypothetical protein
MGTGGKAATVAVEDLFTPYCFISSVKWDAKSLAGNKDEEKVCARGLERE